MIIKPLILIILDGWGSAPAWGGNAISQAKTPNFDQLWRSYPHTTLGASGQFVGLPGHEQGNSEVGHLNIGAGRVVWQDSSRINQAIKDGSFFNNQVFLEAINHAKTNNSNLHLMGLLSTGGIHSRSEHLYALLELAKRQQFERVFLHLFTDGRDTAPMSALQQISHLEKRIRELGIGKIATVSGRYFAMDRDHHWDRIKYAYFAMADGIGPEYPSANQAISANYRQGRSDEFIIPSVITDENNNPLARIDDHDSLIFFNFRSDRARQITSAFADTDFKEFNRSKTIFDLYFVSIIPYGAERELKFDIKSAFASPAIINTLASVLAEDNLAQFHIAETEKYAHTTYFFNGGREEPFPLEERVLVPSVKVPTFDLAPEMSVHHITKELLARIKSKKYSLILANFANADMVGHSGNLKATIEACEAVDHCLGQLFALVNDLGATMMVTADHGNAEEMLDPKTGQINTEHSCNPVPFILVNGPEIKFLKTNGVLADIAPTILQIMQLCKPKEMTGVSLII